MRQFFSGWWEGRGIDAFHCLLARGFSSVFSWSHSSLQAEEDVPVAEWLGLQTPQGEFFATGLLSRIIELVS